MNWKTAVRRSFIILVILALSVLTGFLYQKIWDRIDRSRYPRIYAEYVAEYSETYGVPEYIIYSVIKVESDFDSSAVSQAGAVGLMQIMPSTFDWISQMLNHSYEYGMLYDPQTNIEYGTYLLSYLYMRYNSWDTAFAAYNAGSGRVDSWLLDPSLLDKDGTLVDIPFPETEHYVKKIKNTVETYKRLYY